MRKTIIFVLVFFGLIALVAAIGIVLPHPNFFELRSGESGTFYSQIQTGDNDMSCSTFIKKDSLLELSFSDLGFVPANSRFNFQGEVFVPEGTQPGRYVEEYCVKCSPLGSGGIIITPIFCGNKITVEVPQPVPEVSCEFACQYISYDTGVCLPLSNPSRDKYCTNYGAENNPVYYQGNNYQDLFCGLPEDYANQATIYDCSPNDYCVCGNYV